MFCKRCSQKFPKIHRKTPILKCLYIKKRLQHRFFPVNFARFFRTLSHVIQNRSSKKSRKIHGKIHSKIPGKIHGKIHGKISCERLLLVFVRIGPVWTGANLLMFCRTDCKSVFKVLSLSTEMQFSTDLALMSTQPTY